MSNVSRLRPNRTGTRLRAYVVVCVEYETPCYGTREEAEAHQASITDFDACPLEHRLEERWLLPSMATESVWRAHRQRLAEAEESRRSRHLRS